jgi:hypothetical protein
VRIIWSEIAQATFARFMADQAGMMAVNRAVEALADDPAPPGAFLRGAYRRLQERIAPSSQQRCTAAQPLPARWAERGGAGLLAEGAGQAAESAATAGRVRPAFQPADGGHTHSGPGGQFLL